MIYDGVTLGNGATVTGVLICFTSHEGNIEVELLGFLREAPSRSALASSQGHCLVTIAIVLLSLPSYGCHQQLPSQVTEDWYTFSEGGVEGLLVGLPAAFLVNLEWLPRAAASPRLVAGSQRSWGARS